MPAGVSKFLTNSGELSSQDEYVRIWPNMAIYVCKITVLGPMPFTYRGRSLTVAAQQVCRFSNFYRFTEPTWGRQSCLGTRFPARPSRLKSRLAAKIGCPHKMAQLFHDASLVLQR